MIESEFKVMNRCLAMINTRIALLEDKNRKLWDHITEKYPEDMYGMKGEMLYHQQVTELQREISLMRKWQKAWWDALEIIEGRYTHD